MSLSLVVCLICLGELTDIGINISLIFHSSFTHLPCVCVCARARACVRALCVPCVCMITNHIDAFGHKKSARAGLKQLRAGIQQR